MRPETGLWGLLSRRVPALGALRTYSWAQGRADTLAGLTVATVAVPQAMAYGIAAGVSAEHGLYTAIVMTAVGAVLDSSKQLINGPTNVISIAVLSALATFPADQKVQGAITLALLIGAFQTAITLLRLGDLTRYISHSVVVGFTAGASLLLVLDQMRNLFGWASKGDPHDHFLVRLWHTWSEGGAPHGATIAIGLTTMVAIVALRWGKRRLGWVLFPELLLVVMAMTAITGWLHLDESGVKVVGAIPAKLPSFAPPVLDLEQVRDLSGSALAIATLGLLEALAMAKNIAAVTGQKLDLNQQCLSEGLANMTGSCFQCIPGSGSLTRSAINQQAGAQTQWSGVISAAAVALIMVVFAPYAAYVPRSALAGLLIVSAFGMIDWRGLWFHLRATPFDAVIVTLTGFAAVAISVEFCILIGVIFSFLLAVPRAGRMTMTEFVLDRDGVVRERERDEPCDERVLIFGLEGELFFGSVIAIDEHLDEIAHRARDVVVLRVKRIRNPDAVGLYELAQFARKMHERGVRLLLAGARQDLLVGLRKTGLMDEIGEDQVFTERAMRGTSSVEAIRAAYAYLGRVDADTPAGATPAPAVRHVQD
ncbi:MAG: SulP family inorganic anion transporter [Myxococcota bacterium]